MDSNSNGLLGDAFVAAVRDFLERTNSDLTVMSVEQECKALIDEAIERQAATVG